MLLDLKDLETIMSESLPTDPIARHIVLAKFRDRFHDGNRLEVCIELEPSPMDTLGTLIDKLITVDMKMWHNQELLYAIRRMTGTDFVDRYGTQAGLAEVHGIVKRCCDLNLQRSRLMDAVDVYFAGALAGDQSHVNLQHKTY